jgi:hypothetical protein
MKKQFDLSTISSCSKIPACRALEVIDILIEIDPIWGEHNEKSYPERVEKFSRNYIWQKISWASPSHFFTQPWKECSTPMKFPVLSIPPS